MVDGTGLENQRWKHPQVRILFLPPEISFLGGYDFKVLIAKGREDCNKNKR